MKDMTRADRRRRDRLKKSEARAALAEHFPAPEKIADHMAHCSCHMCGNPRKHFGELTMQERRANEAEQAQMADLNAQIEDDLVSAM